MIGIKQVLSSRSDRLEGLTQMTVLGIDGKIWDGYRVGSFKDIRMVYDPEWTWKIEVEGINESQGN